MHTKSIPTLYRGRYYRSRLEARYAALFDAFDWPHEYEPFDLTTGVRGYIPDFVLRFDRPLLVEVKPYLLPFGEDAFATCRKIVAAWPDDALLVGANHIVNEDEHTDPEIHLDESGMFPVRHADTLARLMSGGTIEIGRMRSTRSAWSAAYIAHDGRCWYVSTVDDPCTHLDGPHYEKARWAWASGGNASQWRGTLGDS